MNLLRMKRKVGQDACVNGQTKVYVSELDALKHEVELVMMVPKDVVITKRDLRKIFKLKK